MADAVLPAPLRVAAVASRGIAAARDLTQPLRIDAVASRGLHLKMAVARIAAFVRESLMCSVKPV